MALPEMDTVIRHLRQVLLRQDVGQTDGQLLTSFIAHKGETAFEALIRRHGQMVFGVCRRIVGNHHDAEDSLQATFLVLARKASSVKPRERVANWLHGVALRTAMKAKAMSAKRRAREKQMTSMPEPERRPQDPWRDLQPLIDQELNGLPEIYRLPILLCDLEGKSIKEATRQLGWPQGTLAGRLARARKLLAKRLASRGVALSTASLAAILSQNPASSAVPPALVISTVKAVAMIAAGQATLAGVVPAKVAALMEGVLTAMFLSKLKTVTAGLLLAAILSGAAGAIYQTQAAGQPKNEPKTKTAPAATAFRDLRPPQVDNERQYAIMPCLLEAGADVPKELVRLPKITVEEGQLAPVHITDNPQNLLEKVVLDEKIKIGTFLDMRVKRLGGNKVRLYVTFQKNELEKASVSEIRVLGHNVQAIEEVELREVVKIVFQKDATGAAQRWLEIIVDGQTRPAVNGAPSFPAAPPMVIKK